MQKLPARIDSGFWHAGHVQGIAVDVAKGYAYFSFTTLFVKTTLDGAVVGSVRGLVGHLGCIALGADGRVYGSLEYKRDAIGQGIRASLGLDDMDQQDGFYVAIFDTDKITRWDMDAERDGVVRAVHLAEVLDDYAAQVDTPAGPMPHRYGCSGIDGISFGPPFGGMPDDRHDLYVAYGVYGDTARGDNDHQVLLRYDVSGWDAIALPLDQAHPHRQGPAKPHYKYFVYTGNTTYGIQNLEYDAHTGNWLTAVYRGKKADFPNHSLYIIDGHTAPKLMPLKGLDGEQGYCLSLWPHGLFDEASGIYGWESEYGATGMFSLGDGTFYLSHDRHGDAGFASEVHRYRWTGAPPCPFMIDDEI